MSSRQASLIWEAALGELQLKVTRPSYDTWLKETEGLSFNENQLVVGTINTFAAEMLEQRMHSLITHAVRKVANAPVQVRFRVMPRKLEQTNTLPTLTEPPQESTGLSGSSDIPTSTGDSWPLRLNPKYRFETFVVGKSNELAHAAAMAVAQHPGTIYNPLFIYSDVGLGKTHLLHAMAHRVVQRNLSVIYASTEQFTNEYIKAIREGKTEDFRNKYRGGDVLLLDDIQFIIGKEQTQEGFFHTFNTLHMNSRQIVVTSDRPAKALTLLEDRIRSRFEGGLVVDIQAPDLETRLAILKNKADQLGVRFPDDILELIGRRVHRNIRELEGNLNRVVAFSDITREPITADLVNRALADLLTGRQQSKATPDSVIAKTSSYFGLDQSSLMGRRRDKKTALTRQIAMYLLREEANRSFTEIGRLLGDKDHSTVIHACNRIAAQINSDPHLRQDVLNIRENIQKNRDS
ncbi:MAG: chromosomal replication initiator protein DnaA [Chloroflexi bacterium]|nr:chromosomal replication initiator protein DnaA [Chloroflexota bacterium]